MSTGLYVLFAVSMIANIYGTYLLINLAERAVRDKDTIARLEALCRNRTAHLDELKQIVREMEEDDDYSDPQSPALQPAEDNHSMQAHEMLHSSPQTPGNQLRDRSGR